MHSKNWSREELIVAFNLYCKTPFTKINSSNKGIKALASIIKRSDSSVALKLANFARLDPALRERNISGMRNGSKGEVEIWREFNQNWETLTFESERILAKYKGDSVEEASGILTEDLPPEGKERDAIVKVRVNQSFFRNMILASYDNKCSISNIKIPSLLVASHIIPWSVSDEHRMNPGNGICLNAIHDKAFDKGLVTITPDYFFVLSGKLIESLSKEKESDQFFLPYHQKKISLPQKFYPCREFLEYHNQLIFQK